MNMMQNLSLSVCILEENIGTLYTNAEFKS